MKTKPILPTLFAATASVLFAPLVARGDVTLPEIFSDGMVLQRNAAIPLWGTADAGETVSVVLGAQKQTTVAGVDGRWMVKMAPMPAGGPLEVTVSGKNTLKLQNVVLGEVWLASGQSNMELRLPRVTNADQEIAAANYPLIRMFRVGRSIADTPQSAARGAWVAASPQTADQFTAVGYFFARELQKKLGVPIGLIHASYGGTPAQAWTSRAAMQSNPDLQGIFAQWEKTLADYPQAKQKYDEQMVRWKERAALAKAEGKPEPAALIAPPGPGGKATPAGLYNGMIAPLIPYAIKGVIWYQGESNTREPELYRKLFPALVTDWRRAWGIGDFPFLWVQLANFHKPQSAPAEEGWASLREAQTMTLALPNTGQAVSIDIGEAGDIHYRNKQDAGKRLALVALATQYGEKIEYSGPSYEGAEIEKGRIRLKFTHAAGLMAQGGGELKGFAIAGKDGVFVWAQARIDGADVVVSSPQVPDPVAARYNWADNPIGNFYNAVGLPASSFRTDVK